MALIQYTPSENWTSFRKKAYNLEFDYTLADIRGIQQALLILFWQSRKEFNSEICVANFPLFRFQFIVSYIVLSSSSIIILVSPLLFFIE